MLSLRLDYPIRVKKILESHGEDIIDSIEIGRTPVPRFLKFLLNVISFGEFGKRFRQSEYNNLYHLFMIIITIEGVHIQLEKNQTISSKLNFKIPDNAELMEVDTIPENITINKFLFNGLLREGREKFFTYSSASNNCQDFILNLLLANHIEGDILSFVKQDITHLFEGLTRVRKVTNTVTDVAGIADTVIHETEDKILSRNYIRMAELDGICVEETEQFIPKRPEIHHHHYNIGNNIDLKKLGRGIKRELNKSIPRDVQKRLADKAIRKGIPLVTELIKEAVSDPVGKLVVGFAMNSISDAIKKDISDDNNEEVNKVNTLENA
jgi:hypothetical protein